MMKRQMTIGKKIAILALSLVVLSAAQGVVALLNLRAFDTDVVRLAEGNLPATRSLAEILPGLYGFRGNALQHLLASNVGDKAAFEKLQEALRDRLKNDMAAYEASITEADDRSNFDLLRRQQTVFFDTWDKTVRPLSRQGASQRAYGVYLQRMAPQFTQLASTLEKMRTWNGQRGGTLAAAAKATGESGQVWTWALLGSMIVVGAFLSWFLAHGINQGLRQMVKELTQGGDRVASAAGQIAGSSLSLSQGASEQAASLEEVSASIEQMAAMTKRNAENSSQAMAMMLETAGQVERSNTALQAMVVSMSSIKDSSERVGKINKTIDEIAFQTNILALNAAVEAARAGSAGMGFAVVAGEVRNLAQRSAVAAKDTAVLIEQAVANSGEGAEKLEHVAEAIRAITEGAAKVKNLVEEVNEASRQQAQGIDQVAKAITQINTVTQTNAASAEQSAAASQQMTAQSQEMRRLMATLSKMVEGDAVEVDKAEEKNTARRAASAAGAGRSSKSSPASPIIFKALASSAKSATAPRQGRPAAAPATVPSAVLTAEEEFPMESDAEGGFHSF